MANAMDDDFRRARLIEDFAQKGADLLIGGEFATLRLGERFVEGGRLLWARPNERRLAARERHDDARDIVLHRRGKIARRGNGLVEKFRHSD